MTKNYRDARTGQYTTAADAAARPAETVAESVPNRHETPDVAELRRRLDALPGFTLKYIGSGPGGYIALSDEGGMPLSESGFDAVLLFAEIAALEVPRLLDRLAHMTEARDKDRAEVERLTAQLDPAREWFELVRLTDEQAEHIRWALRYAKHEREDRRLDALLDGAAIFARIDGGEQS